MSAYDVGVKRARECLRAFSVEQLHTTTLESFCALGRLDAKQRYKREDAQKDYALAWDQVGECFASLFQPSDKKTIVATDILGALHSSLRRANEYIERLRDWEPPTEYMKLMIDDVGNEVAGVVDDIGYLLEQLRQKEQG